LGKAAKIISLFSFSDFAVKPPFCKSLPKVLISIKSALCDLGFEEKMTSLNFIPQRKFS